MLFSKNLDQLNLSDIEEFCVLDLPEDQRPREGLRIDFKSSFPNDLAKFISAFANTTGGIVLIGVIERQGIPQQICGIDLGKSDIKTRITEIAYSTINPPIVPEIGLCRMPTDSTKGVVVIRIQESQYPPHMVIKGGENSIYQRVNDECIRADLQTIETLFKKRRVAAETFDSLLSRYGDLVDLEGFQNGFRAVAIVPEIPREHMIVFNRQTDIFFLENKPPPDIVWPNVPLTPIRGGILFKGKSEATGGKNEFLFSITQEGVINFSETIWEWEKGFGLDRTVSVLVKLLTYAKGIYNKFGYHGKVYVRLRAGRVQGKILTRGGLSWSRSLLKEYKAITDDFSEKAILSTEDIRKNNPEPYVLFISNFVRGLFNFALEDTSTSTLIGEAYESF